MPQYWAGTDSGRVCEACTRHTRRPVLLEVCHPAFLLFVRALKTMRTFALVLSSALCKRGPL